MIKSKGFITEKKLEGSFVTWCKNNGIITIKGPSATAGGFPDRIIILPQGGTLYAEFKGTDDYDLDGRQCWWRDILVKSDPHRYRVVRTLDDVERLKLLCGALIDISAEVISVEDQLLRTVASKDTNFK